MFLTILPTVYSNERPLLGSGGALIRDGRSFERGRSFDKIRYAASRRHCHWTIYQELCQPMYFYHIFVETRDGKACVTSGVCDTENMKITNPKNWPRPRNFYT